MANAEAARTLQEVTAVRAVTRRKLNASWLAFLIWGSIVLGSAPFTQLGDGAAVGIYWALASPIGLLVTWRAYHAYELRLGFFDSNEWIYGVIVGAMVVAAFVLGAAGEGGTLSAVGPLVAIGAGLVLLGLVKSLDPIVGFAGDAMIALGIVLVVAEPGEPALIAALGQAAILLAAGAFTWHRDRAVRADAAPPQTAG